jgi:hypothetical protein
MFNDEMGIKSKCTGFANWKKAQVRDLVGQSRTKPTHKRTPPDVAPVVIANAETA